MTDTEPLEERDGWYVLNVADAPWVQHPVFGEIAVLEKERGLFPHTGVNIHVIHPGRPACRYHREGAQEDFLVLSGECDLLVNGETRRLKAWDFVHCPPGVSHVFVGAGDGPCAVLMIGHRLPDGPSLYYPESELARACGAEAPEPTPDPQVAYADQPTWAPAEEPPGWPSIGSPG